VVMGVRAVPVLCIYSRYVKLNYAVGFCEENPPWDILSQQ